MWRPIAQALQLALVLVGLVSGNAGGAETPNIVLINADDLGYGDLGCYGATKLQTPNIDRLAVEGRRFTDAHTASAVCSPSRYGLMTGQFPLRKNFWGPLPLTNELTIDTSQPTIASVLKSAGYRTAIIGKWHLGFGRGKNDWNKPLKPGPLELGFDYYFGMPTVNSGPPFVYVENHSVVDYDPNDPFVIGKLSVTQRFPEKGGYRAIGGAKKAHERYRDEFVGTTFAQKAVAWIRQHNQPEQSQPFFLYLATTNIHHPFTPHPRFKGTSQCGLYGDFVHELDWIVSEVLNTLDETGLADNTLVIFTSDNGGMLNNTGQKAWKAGHRLNGKLLGFKFGAWEGGHRVPLIVRWPGHVPAGTESDSLVSQIDFLPTLAAVANSAIPESAVIDGVNQLAEFTGDATSPARDMLIISPNSPLHLSVRKDKWMYIPARDEGGFQGKNIGDHLLAGAAAQKLTGLINSDVVDGKIRTDAPPAQLYDLQTDPYQSQNVYDQHPEVVAELAKQLKTWRAKIPKSDRVGWINLKQPAAPRKSTAPGKKSAASKAKPNFVVIFTDDQGYQDVGCFGSPDIRTPRLDAMARQGMKFTSFYAQPICGPSRAALMTGCYPLRVAERGHTKQVHPILHEDEITVAEVLKTQGYATACFGKWDLAKHAQTGFFMDLFPTHQGFDYFYGTPTSNDRVANLYRNEELIEPNSNMATLTRRYTDEAISFMEKHQQQPFFVYIPHTMPHTRLDASAKFKGNSKRGLYGDVIEEIDFNVGRILDAIDELKLRDNTYVLFTSDNGPWLIKNKNHADGHLSGDHGGSAGALRSGKVSTFEGGVRVPAILWAPGRVPPGTTCDAIATTMDVLPTFAALAGAEIPSDRVIDGEDITHLFQGDFENANPEKTYFYYLRVHLQAVRQGKWKLHLPRPKEPVGAAPFSRNTHIAPADRVGFEQPFLVDLTNDPGESTNVAAQNPQVVERLLALAEAMREDLGDFDRVGKNMRFFDPLDSRPERPPVPAPRRRQPRK